MALDLGVEIVDHGRQARSQQTGDGLDPLRVLGGPADVLLQLLISMKQFRGVHG
jgi:hypothetical protein